MKNTTWKLIQTSKEYVNGKYQKVGFYENQKGQIKIKILKK